MSWLDSLTQYAQDGVDAYTQVAGAKRPATPATTTTSTTPAWLIPALIGGGLLVLVLVFIGGRK